MVLKPLATLGLAAGALFLLAAPASAHEEHRLGPLRLSIGWSEEPAYAGFTNGIEVHVTRGREPEEDANLSVSVLFGGPDSATATEPLDLEPVFGEPGLYEAFIIPTRPGTYTFQLAGSIGKLNMKTKSFTSGPETFDDVQIAGDAQFPERDPTAGEIAERLDRIDQRLAALAQGPSDDDEAAAPPGLLPLVISGVAALLALAALVLGLRRRR